MVKYRYLSLFLFGYIMASDELILNNDQRGLDNNQKQLKFDIIHIKNAPEELFEIYLNNFKKESKYDEFESLSYYDATLNKLVLKLSPENVSLSTNIIANNLNVSTTKVVSPFVVNNVNSNLDYREFLPDSNNGEVTTFKWVIIDSPVLNNKEKPLNKQNKKKKKIDNQQNVIGHHYEDSPQIQVPKQNQNITKKIIASQMNHQPLKTKSKNNKKKKNNKSKNKKNKKKNNNDDQILNQAIEQNKKELWEKKEERTFIDQVNDMVLTYKLYKERTKNSKFHSKKGPLLLEFLDVVGFLLDEEVLTEEGKKIRKEKLLPLYKKIKQESVIWCDTIKESSSDDEN